jgi:hypothetical protein
MTHDFDRAVIVAVTLVGEMQMTVDQIADVVAVGHGFVATTRSVHVIGTAALVIGGAALGVGGRDLQGMVLHARAGGVVQMTIVQVVNMITVLDGHVATALAVLVGVMVARFV